MLSVWGVDFHEVENIISSSLYCFRGHGSLEIVLK